VFLVGSVLIIFLVFCLVFLVGSVLIIFLVYCLVFLVVSVLTQTPPKTQDRKQKR
jgi:hypothetical protein